MSSQGTLISNVELEEVDKDVYGAKPPHESKETEEATPARKFVGAVQTVFLVFTGLVVLVPIFAIFLATFQSGKEIMRNGIFMDIDWSTLSLDSYVMLFTDSGDYFRWFGNSLFLTVLQVVGTLAVSAFVAYGFAMYDFKGKTAAFVVVLLLLSTPFEMLMLPLYVQVNAWGMENTYAIIVLPFLASATTIFFFRQYFSGLPKELIEAGRVDGVTEYGIFFRLIVPISTPAFAAMGILNGMLAWNNMLWPLLVLRDQSKFTLPIGLNSLLTPYGNNYDLILIGAFFSLLPILILFIAFQRFFVEGMTAGAVKA